MKESKRPLNFVAHLLAVAQRLTNLLCGSNFCTQPWYIRAASWENQQCGFRTGWTQTGLYKHRKELKAWNFGFKYKRNCTIRVAKTKALISFAITAKLICVFVFAYTDFWFSHGAAH